MPITLTTDFGNVDPFVGLMKGVMLGIAPQVAIVDLSHEVPPGDIAAGALVLETVIGHFPAGTIHVGVVDPGVGGGRIPIAIHVDDDLFVGPDNGLFTAVLKRCEQYQAVALTNRDYHHHPVSPTFHGRDIFAPVAAHLANGVALSNLGATVEPTTIPLPEPWSVGDALELHILRIDHFGNLITDLTAERFAAWLDGEPRSQISLEVGNRWIHGLSSAFTDVEPDAPLAYFGSAGRLEIAIRDGHAGDVLEASRDTLIQLTRQGLGAGD